MGQWGELRVHEKDTGQGKNREQVREGGGGTHRRDQERLGGVVMCKEESGTSDPNTFRLRCENGESTVSGC